MEHTKDSVVTNIDELIKKSEHFEKQFVQENYNLIHDWLFHIREVLLDIRKLNLILSDFFENAEQIIEMPTFLRNLTKFMLYEFDPHVKYHMTELERNLDVHYPESEHYNKNIDN